MSPGTILFAAAPLILGAILLRIDPRCRRVRARSILAYLLLLFLLLWGAMQFVGWVASSRVRAGEVVVAVWFTAAWRLAWAIWIRTEGRWGQRRVRQGRLARRRGIRVPLLVRLIPAGRAALTGLLFFPLFLSTVITHRVKLGDDQDPQSVFTMRYEAVRIPTQDGLTLDGWFIPEPGAERTLLICHGAGANKGNFVWFLGPLAHHGYNVLFFDFRAHGMSDGRLTTYGIREERDVRGAVDWLRRERASQSNVVVGLGSSQGAMALALAACEDPRIAAVVLDSPFTSPRELVHGGADRLPVAGPLLADWMLALVSLQSGTNFFTASAERAVAHLGARPVFVVHGDGDVMMPVSHARRLYEAARGPRELWLGPGSHSNIITTEPEEYARRVFAFLDQHLGKAPRAWPRRAGSAPAGAAIR